MAIKARNFSVKTQSVDAEVMANKIEPIPTPKAPSKPMKGNVAVKLVSKMEEAKRLAEEKLAARASIASQSFKEVLYKAKLQNSAPPKQVFSKVEETRHIERQAYSMGVIMKDQIIKSSKYLQDLTYEEK